MKIGITYDLRDDYLKQGFSEEETAEFDKTSTIDSIESALQSLGHSTIRIGNIKDLVKYLSQGLRCDLVFNICEGLYGLYSRESQVPSLLEAYNIPYTFSDPIATGITLKKDMAKSVVRTAGIKTPEYHVVIEENDINTVKMPYPLFIKPLAEGTGKGITDKSKVNNFNELHSGCIELLKKYKQPVLVETYCSGREFTAGITGTGSDSEYIGALEIILNDKAEKNAYSYINKEFCESLVEYKLVTDNDLNLKLANITKKVWTVLECRDAGRIDFIIDKDGELNFIEVNPLAGIHPEHSDLPIICNKVGISYKELIKRIIDSASKRIKS